MTQLARALVLQNGSAEDCEFQSQCSPSTTGFSWLQCVLIMYANREQPGAKLATLSLRQPVFRNPYFGI